jgi:hypothetical protein
VQGSPAQGSVRLVPIYGPKGQDNLAQGQLRVCTCLASLIGAEEQKKAQPWVVLFGGSYGPKGQGNLAQALPGFTRFGVFIAFALKGRRSTDFSNSRPRHEATRSWCPYRA